MCASPSTIRKAKKLVESGGLVKIPTAKAWEDMYRVNSSSSSSHYTVKMEKGKRVCNCEGFTNYYRMHNAKTQDGKRTMATCSHIEAVKLFKEQQGLEGSTLK